MAGVVFLVIVLVAAMSRGVRAQVLSDIGAGNPIPGAADISQLTTSGNQTKPDGLNYYTDNQTSKGTGEPGQTFTTGTNTAGYFLSTVFIKTAGLNSYNGIGTGQPYYLHLYSVSGGNATLLQTYNSANITFNDGDWLQWSGLSVALQPNATYAYSFGKASSTNGWEALAVASGNPYAGGEIGLFPTSGGAITFGSSHGFDAVFDLGLSPATGPGISQIAVSPMNTVLVGTPVTFTASVVGAQPLYFQWQFDSGGGYANIPGVVSNKLAFSAATTNSGSYQLILSNSYGAITSAPVTLATINTPANGNVTFGGGGYVDGIIACPTATNLFYCKTDVGGAYRWDETNQAWVALLDWCSPSQTTYQGVESLAIDPSTPQNLYLFVGTSYWNGDASAILCSTNYGATFAITDTSAQFKATGNGGNRQKGEELAVDPNKGSILFCGSRANGLFQSTNSGATWNAVNSFNANIIVASNQISFVQFDNTTGTPGNPTQRIFVGVYTTNANVFMSTNAGVNWTALTGSPSNSWPERCALAANNQLYITYGNDPAGAIMKYTTTNGFWTNVTPARGTLTYCGISASVSNPQMLVASTYSEYKLQPWGPYGDLIFVSTNGGTSWVDIFGSGLATESGNGYAWAQGNQINWAGVTIDPFNPNRVFTGSGNGLYCTTNLNYGLTTSNWKFMVKNLEETVPIAFISVPGGPFITSIGDYGGIVSTNIFVPALTAAISQSTSFAYAAQQSNFIARVENNGNLLYAKQTPVTWTHFSTMPAGMSNGYVAISADGSTVLWKSASCYLTTNLGANWTASTGLTFTCDLKADSVNSSKFYAYNSANGFLYASTNGGLNFNQAGSAGTGGATTFCTAPGFEGHVWIAMNNSGLQYSTNSGATFSSANVSVCNALAFGKAAPGANYPTLYIWGQPTSVSTTGMYRSTDQGVTWLRVNDNNHQYGGLGNAGIIEADKNVYGRVYMSTAGRGVAYMDSAVNVTNLTMSPAAFFTFVTGTQQLTAAVLPANATYPTITWASTNAAIASVDASGLVTANAAGTTTITATTLDGSFVAGSVVTVTNLLSPPFVNFTTGSGSAMNLFWPADHRGWMLQVQTNNLTAGLGTNWFTIQGSAITNQMTLPINPANGSVFYRLVSP